MMVRMSSESALICGDSLLCDTSDGSQATTAAGARLTNYCPEEFVGYLYSLQSNSWSNNGVRNFPGYPGSDRCKAIVWDQTTQSLSMGAAISMGEGACRVAHHAPKGGTRPLFSFASLSDTV